MMRHRVGACGVLDTCSARGTRGTRGTRDARGACGRLVHKCLMCVRFGRLGFTCVDRVVPYGTCGTCGAHGARLSTGMVQHRVVGAAFLADARLLINQKRLIEERRVHGNNVTAIFLPARIKCC